MTNFLSNSYNALLLCLTFLTPISFLPKQILSVFASFGFSCFFSGFLFLTVDGGASCLHIYSDIPESDIIPTRNWFYQDKDQSSLSLGSRDLFCSFIGQFQPKHRHQCHWHCSLRCHGFTISGQLIS